MVIEPLSTGKPLSASPPCARLSTTFRDPHAMHSMLTHDPTPRRTFLGTLAAAFVTLAWKPFLTVSQKPPMSITCFIRYEIDPYQRAAFAQYADDGPSHPALRRRSPRLLPSARGDQLRGFALISFESLAAYESYRKKLLLDADGRANFDFAQRRSSSCARSAPSSRECRARCAVVRSEVAWRMTRVLILPGLYDSGPDHWQSHWVRTLPDVARGAARLGYARSRGVGGDPRARGRRQLARTSCSLGTARLRAHCVLGSGAQRARCAAR